MLSVWRRKSVMDTEQRYDKTQNGRENYVITENEIGFLDCWKLQGLLTISD